MTKPSPSPRSQQRLRVFEAYRGRGKRTNDLWLIYSVKTNRDWILSSNRQLVHWLVFLETCRSVKSFDFAAPDSEPPEETGVTVSLADGSKERHFVGLATSPRLASSELIATATASEITRIFTDVELRPRVPLAMRWHKAIAFAATMRNKEHAQLRLALVPLLREMQRGVLRQLTEELNSFEEALICGMLVRLAIEGHVELDLSTFGFCRVTPWRWDEGDTNVVA